MGDDAGIQSSFYLLLLLSDAEIKSTQSKQDIKSSFHSVINQDKESLVQLLIKPIRKDPKMFFKTNWFKT